MYRVTHKKWNVHVIRRSSSRTVSETISLDHCSEGWSCWATWTQRSTRPSFTAMVEANCSLPKLFDFCLIYVKHLCSPRRRQSIDVHGVRTAPICGREGRKGRGWREGKGKGKGMEGWGTPWFLVIFIRTMIETDRQTDRPDEKQYNQYSSQNTKARKTSQTDALQYPRDCPHTEYTEHNLLNS